jgi:hypothetical protein
MSTKGLEGQNMRTRLGAFLAGIAVAAMLAVAPSAFAQSTIKVGILHSLSGTMAISETTLKDVMSVIRMNGTAEPVL